MKKVLRLLPTCVAMNSKVGDTHELRWEITPNYICRVQFTVNKVTHKDGCLENEDRRPKTKDLEKEDPLENEDLEKEDPLENEDLEKEDPLENEDLENEDPLENEDLENEDPLENEDLENEDPLENEDLENEDPLENEDLENEDPLENEDLENEDPLEKHENRKQQIEAESSLAYLQISKMAETWPCVIPASLQVPVLFSDKRAQNI